MTTLINCAVIGSPQCGKTSFIHRIVDGTFSSEKCPIDESHIIDKRVRAPAVHYSTKYGKCIVRLIENGSVWSREIDAYIVMIDITSIKSFNYASKCIDAITQDNPFAQIVLVVTKHDLLPARGIVARIRRLLLEDENHCIGGYEQISSLTSYRIVKPMLSIMRQVTRHPDLTIRNDEE